MDPLPYFYSEQDGGEIRDGLNLIVQYYNSGEFAGAGWSPVLGIASDGERRVWEILDWVGGVGDKPPVGYVGETGIVPNIGAAINVRGPGGEGGEPGPANQLSIGTVTDGETAGATITGTPPSQTLNLTLPKGAAGADGSDGSDGWTPVFAVAVDGERRVVRILDWLGGTGTKPDTGYLGTSGVVATPGEAIDVRGAPGSGSVSSVNSVDPDGAGNVVLNIADIPGLEDALSNAGAVKTVNSKEPDENGDVVVGIEDISGLSGALSGLGSGLDNKVDKVAGYGLSQEDYTSAEKSKLSGIQAGAQVNPGDATTSTPGLMSAADKVKLDGIAAGAQVNPAKMPENEALAGTATTQRTIDADTLRKAIAEHAGEGGGTNGQGDRYVGTSGTPPSGEYEDGDIYLQVLAP